MNKFSDRYSSHHKIVLGYCYLCGGEIYSMKDASIDHKNPISRSHDNSNKNKELCCKECNHEKGMLTVEEYRIWKVLNSVRNGDKNPVNLRIIEDLLNFMKQKQK